MDTTGTLQTISGSLVDTENSLVDTTGDLQVILLTEDEAIASWARLEAMAGELALVEPAMAND